MVVCGEMKILLPEVDLQVDGNGVVQRDGHKTAGDHNFDVVVFDIEAVPDRFLVEVVLNVRIGLAGKRALGKAGLGGHGIVELIVRNIDRNDLHGEKDETADDDQGQNHVEAAGTSLVHPSWICFVNGDISSAKLRPTAYF